MSKSTLPLCAAILIASSFFNTPLSAKAEKKSEGDKKSSLTQPQVQRYGSSLFQPFTGAVIADRVRVRSFADVDSPIALELQKGDLVVANGEKNGFYAIQAPKNAKVYVFRSFVLDNIVEGERVNVRLSPDLEAPIIGHLNTGDKIDGKVSEKNNKWLEVSPHKSMQFFVAKEYLEPIGPPALKEKREAKEHQLCKLVDSVDTLKKAEFAKPFADIDLELISTHLQTIIDQYTDFPAQVEKAKIALSHLKEEYLEKKIAYLEAKTGATESIAQGQTHNSPSATDRMKNWEPIERGMFLSWSAMHQAKNIDDFYREQKAKAAMISGVLEYYQDPVRKKPGDFVLKDKDVPVAYVYSTQVNLDALVGQQIKLLVNPRPNNSFAFPAYHVLEAEK